MALGVANLDGAGDAVGADEDALGVVGDVAAPEPHAASGRTNAMAARVGTALWDIT